MAVDMLMRRGERREGKARPSRTLKTRACWAWSPADFCGRGKRKKKKGGDVGSRESDSRESFRKSQSSRAKDQKRSRGFQRGPARMPKPWPKKEEKEEVAGRAPISLYNLTVLWSVPCPPPEDVWS